MGDNKMKKKEKKSQQESHCLNWENEPIKWTTPLKLLLTTINSSSFHPSRDGNNGNVPLKLKL